MILISQGHFTFELTLAGLLEDILTRFRNERILLSLSDPAIGIQGELLIAEATIFAARVDKPLVEGYAALKNLCQFAGAEFAINKLDNAEIEPLKRSICIDLAKLVKVVPALPTDPTSLLSASAFAPVVPSHGVVGAPVVVSVPPVSLPPLPQQQGEGSAIALEQGSISAKQRIDMAFEAAIQKRVATKGKGKIDLLSGKSASQVFADAPVNNLPQTQPLPQPQQISQQQQPQAFNQPGSIQSRPVESIPASAKVPDIVVPVDNKEFKSDPFSQKINYAPKEFNLVNESHDFADEPADFPEDEEEGDIDWHRVRAAAEKVEPVSKEPTISFSLAEQIQQELAAGDQVEVSEPLQRKALKRSFVGPVAAIRLAVAKLWRIAIPVGIILAIMQGGKMWMDTHGGSNNVKSVMDMFGTKPVKHAPPAAAVAHKEVSKPVGHAVSHQNSIPRSSGVKVVPSKTSASRVAAKSVAPSDAAKPNAPVGAPISAYERISNKYANSAIMRDPVKPAADASGRRHAYQTAPSDGNAGQ